MIDAHEFASNSSRYARLAHEARAARQTPPDKHWEELSPALRQMTVSQVADIPRKLAAIGLVLVESDSASAVAFEVSDEGLERLAEMEHDRWCAVKLEQGWRQGERTDPGAMTHVSLVPYRALPESEKEKDREMVRRIPEQLTAIGLAVAPR